jgi:hypothetical protein
MGVYNYSYSKELNDALTLWDDYCKSPEWAMKFDTEAKAKDRLDYFFKNKFHNLFEMKIVKIQETHFYKEIKNDSDRNPQGKTTGNLR